MLSGETATMTTMDSIALTAIVRVVETAPDTAVSIASVSFVNRFKRRPERGREDKLQNAGIMKVGI